MQFITYVYASISGLDSMDSIPLVNSISPVDSIRLVSCFPPKKPWLSGMQAINPESLKAIPSPSTRPMQDAPSSLYSTCRRNL